MADGPPRLIVTEPGFGRLDDGPGTGTLIRVVAVTGHHPREGVAFLSYQIEWLGWDAEGQPNVRRAMAPFYEHEIIMAEPTEEERERWELADCLARLA